MLNNFPAAAAANRQIGLNALPFQAKEMKKKSGIVAHYLFRPLLIRYLAKKRRYHYDGVSISVLPGVFHPGLFFSTKYLLQQVLQYDLKNRSLLEPGAGSGLISFVAEKHGAIVTASDISSKAVQNLHLNKAALHANVAVIQSDLFDGIAIHTFDFIVINPPYYPKEAATEEARAWYCGANYEYFEKLFSGIHPFIHAGTKTLMVLSEECDLDHIKDIAAKNKCSMKEVSSKKFWWEWNYIFEVTVTGNDAAGR